MWGGGEAPKHHYPWMALVQINLGNRDVEECGGSLISDDTILTAAHCLTIKLTHNGIWSQIRKAETCSSAYHYLEEVVN